MRTDAGRQDPLLTAVQLLDLYGRGLLPAIVSSAAREEQRLPRLSGEERDAVLALLDLPTDREVQAAAVEAMGPKEALSLLQGVLRQPDIPAPGYPYIVTAYQEQHVNGVTWLLEEVRIWLTGLTVATSMWTAWPADTPIPELGVPPAIRWRGFAEIRDDVGTEYTDVGGAGAGPSQPAVVSSSIRTAMPIAQQSIRYLRPGPPPQARELVLRLDPIVGVAEPTTSPPPWPEREVQLPETIYVLHLDHRKEWLRRNQKGEWRARDGVRACL